MKKLSKMAVWSFSLLVSLFVYFVYAYHVKSVKGYGEVVRCIGSCISLYIETNGGYFPETKEDLISQGFIRVYAPGNMPGRYWVRYWGRDIAHFQERKTGPIMSEAWWPRVPLDKFHIRYGVRIEEITAVGRRLYDRTTRRQVFLLDTPYRWGRSEQEVERVSFELYRQMLRLQRGASSKTLNRPSEND